MGDILHRKFWLFCHVMICYDSLCSFINQSQIRDETEDRKFFPSNLKEINQFCTV